MGRAKRIAFGGYVYQVLNRANGRLRIFKKGGDFEAFEQVLSEGIEHAGDWRWSSFSVRQGRESKVGPAEGPIALPGDWESLVHCEIDCKSAEEIGKSVKRGRPLGDADWRTGTAKELNFEATLREKGRPKKVPDTFT